jgi:hypothetical protein
MPSVSSWIVLMRFVRAASLRALCDGVRFCQA